MNAGDFRHRITIQDRIVTKDDEGGEIVTFMDWAIDVPAAIAPLSGREFVSANTELGQVSARLAIRWRPGVRPTMRAIHNGAVYNIAAVLPDADTGRSHITLVCIEGVNDG